MPATQLGHFQLLDGVLAVLGVVNNFPQVHCLSNPVIKRISVINNFRSSINDARVTEQPFWLDVYPVLLRKLLASYPWCSLAFCAWRGRQVVLAKTWSLSWGLCSRRGRALSEWLQRGWSARAGPATVLVLKALWDLFALWQYINIWQNISLVNYYSAFVALIMSPIIFKTPWLKLGAFLEHTRWK